VSHYTVRMSAGYRKSLTHCYSVHYRLATL